MPVRKAAAMVAVIPSARQLITSLRDVGHDFVHAAADFVDKSITPGANQVAATLRFHGIESWGRVADYGAGMEPGEARRHLRGFRGGMSSVAGGQRPH